ncbi:Delta(5) desaturase DesA [Cohnella fermenti]|uniref:Fatty acid desaturase n=1 Tax=Cohnella fermenti TaxID=2565925 RepID=A0A4S4BLW0_9BACL|nr:fatty acid desaturase [Cohnella fermenti]THF75771.1 fatty acid desaturase [Cohnella fermenti]
MAKQVQQKQLQLKKDVSPFENTDTRRSVRQLFTSLVPLAALWYGSYLSLSVSFILSLVIGVVAAGFVLRTFIIFHDCCHMSFFRNRKLNKIVGTITGAITLTPFEQWKYSHAMHHATSSNLDKRGIGDIWILTVEEYRAASVWKKLQYRIYRNPIVMFGLGPIYIFLLLYRFNRRGAKRKERINTYVTNLLIVLLYAALILLVGWKAFLLVQVPIFWFSGVFGIWLFYVQHQFEESYFEKDDEWSYVKAAVEGSSYYKLPKLLQWMSGNIGFHHVHHLSPKVPNYRLEEAHNATPPLQQATTITLRTSLASLRFKLWDEAGRRFVRFRDAVL